MINTVPVDDEGTSLKLRRETMASSDIDSLPGHWEIQVKRSSFAGAALDANLSRMFLDNAVSNRKAQTCTAALAFPGGCLRGEERIVDALNVLLGNTGAGVGNDDTDALPIRSGNPEGAAIWHRVLGIQEQVEEDLLQSTGVALNQRQAFGKFVLHRILVVLNWCSSSAKVSVITLFR